MEMPYIYEEDYEEKLPTFIEIIRKICYNKQKQVTIVFFGIKKKFFLRQIDSSEKKEYKNRMSNRNKEYTKRYYIAKGVSA